MADPPKRPQDEKDYLPPMVAAPPEAIMDPEDQALREVCEAAARTCESLYAGLAQSG